MPTRLTFFASRSGPPLSLDSHHDRGAPSDYIYSQADYTSCHWPACAVAMQGHTTPAGQVRLSRRSWKRQDRLAIPRKRKRHPMQPIRFPARGGFHETVKQRVKQYFADSRRSTTGDWRLFVKTGVILAWLAGSYALLVFGSTSF